MKYRYAVPPPRLMLNPLPKVEWRDVDGLRVLMHTLLQKTDADQAAHDYVERATPKQLIADLKANGFVFTFRQRLKQAGLWDTMIAWEDLTND